MPPFPDRHEHDEMLNLRLQLTSEAHQRDNPLCRGTTRPVYGRSRDSD